MEKASALILGLITAVLGLAACTSAVVPRDPTSIDPTDALVLHTGTPSTPPSPEITPSPSPTNNPPTETAPPLTQTSTSTPIPSPTPMACLLEKGKVTQFTLATPLEPRPWQFRVYTPPCYEASPDQHYPLLILIHGSTFTDDQWDRLGADETADRLIRQGEAPPFLILMPRDRVWTDPLEDPFGQAVIEYLLPWVDANFRTIPSRDFRAIGGLSRGASWAVHLGISNWDLFSAIGAHSLPVFVSDPGRLTRWLDEIPSGSVPRIYMDIGEKDYLLEKALWFEQLLTEKNIPHEWHLYPGRHEETYWEAHLEEYLRWYTSGW